MTIYLGCVLLHTANDLPETSKETGRFPLPLRNRIASYLVFLRVEITSFHSGLPLLLAFARKQGGHCPALVSVALIRSFCEQKEDGRYPLRCSMVPGLSS